MGFGGMSSRVPRKCCCSKAASEILTWKQYLDSTIISIGCRFLMMGYTLSLVLVMCVIHACIYIFLFIKEDQYLKSAMLSSTPLFLSLILLFSNAHGICITPDETIADKDSRCNITFSQVVANPDEYFTSDTTLVFLPGTHTINSITTPCLYFLCDDVTQIVIAGVNNLILVGSERSPSIILCHGDLGFAFVHVKSLNISNLQFHHCGAEIPEILIPPRQMFTAFHYQTSIGNPLLLLINSSDTHIINVYIQDTSGPGLLGINVLGHSSISRSLFIRNNPNCIFMFSDMPKAPSTLSLFDSKFLFGTAHRYFDAGGLSIVFGEKQLSSTASIIISNVTTYENKGPLYGNMLLLLNECNLQRVKIQVEKLNCSNSHEVGLEISLKRHQCNSSTLSPDNYYISILNSHFSNNDVAFEVWQATNELGAILFDNVTISQHKTVFTVTIDSANIIFKNLNYTHNAGTLYIYHSTVYIQGESSFTENSGYWGALEITRSFISFEGNISFMRNKGHIGGAVYAYGSRFQIKHIIRFVNNEGYDGGAIAFHEDCYMILQSESIINFTGNYAGHYGGAIYINFVLDYILTLRQSRAGSFFIPYINPESAYNNSTVIFEGNKANDAGSALYGGWVDILTPPNGPFFDKYFKIITTNSSDLSVVSSDPIRACICMNSTPSCYITEYNITTYPGQTFYIPTVAVGQRDGVVASTIHSSLFINTTSQPTLETLQYTQKTERVCTNLSYTVRSPNQEETIIITVESKGALVHDSRSEIYAAQLLELHINLDLLSCPPGFVFDNNSCTCDPGLQKHAVSCNIDSEEIEREAPLWINATKDNEGSSGVIVHTHCPFDYCKPYSLNLSLETPDKQCAFNRTRILCGKCQHGLSHVLGSSNCKKCSSIWILLVPAFALAGILLAAFLMLINLTVSVGAINGLIFYANILRVNQAAFFPSSSFLSWFIAWMNLDLGIETCFYDGMDAYAKTWFQFLFPIYIWLIVIIVIISSHYSTTAAKLAGRNAVQVLATLFLISYAKLLQTTITIISSTTLEYPDGSVRRVWLYDANVDYFKGKHIPLFLAAVLVLIFLTVPYTALLFFIQCLQVTTNYRVLFWIGKFKPLFDAYTGPYKDKHRYWTGLLLLVRAILFLVFSINVTGDPVINLLAINITVICLLVYTSFLGGPYKAWSLNAAEYFFFLNLGILSSATLFTTAFTKGYQEALINTSVSTAFFAFCMTVLYHLVISVQSPRHCFFVWMNTQMQTLRLKFRRRPRNPRQNEERDQPLGTAMVATTRQVPITVIELREPLMEYCDRD